MTKESKRLREQLEYNHRINEQKELMQTGSFDWGAFFIGLVMGIAVGLGITFWIFRLRGFI
jgi:hypothetical protein